MFLGSWLGDPRQPGEGFRPVKDKLVVPLSDIFRDRQEERSAERSLATNILADYAADRPPMLADLVQDADEKQFAVLFPKLEAHRERVLSAMNEALATALESKKADTDKEVLAKRQVNAAVVLLRHGPGGAGVAFAQASLHPQAQAYGFSDPRVRSYLIHRLSPLGADPKAIVQRLDEEKDVSIRRALLLILGEFGPDQLVPADGEPLIRRVWQLYQEEPDAGLHAAAEWLLRQWGQQEKLKEFEEEWARNKVKGGEVEGTRLTSPTDPPRRYPATPRWYVNGEGQTMVVVPGRITFQIGSPPTEEGRTGGAEGEE